MTAATRAWTVCRGETDWTEGRGRQEIGAGSGLKENPVPGETRGDPVETGLLGSQGGNTIGFKVTRLVLTRASFFNSSSYSTYIDPARAINPRDKSRIAVVVS